MNITRYEYSPTLAQNADAAILFVAGDKVTIIPKVGVPRFHIMGTELHLLTYDERVVVYGFDTPEDVINFIGLIGSYWDVGAQKIYSVEDNAFLFQDSVSASYLNIWIDATTLLVRIPAGGISRIHINSSTSVTLGTTDGSTYTVTDIADIAAFMSSVQLYSSPPADLTPTNVRNQAITAVGDTLFAAGAELYSIDVYNQNASTAFVRIYDTDVAPTIGVTPVVKMLAVPALSGVTQQLSASTLTLSTGIYVSANGSPDDAVPVALASPVTVQLYYASLS